MPPVALTVYVPLGRFGGNEDGGRAGAGRVRLALTAALGGEEDGHRLGAAEAARISALGLPRNAGGGVQGEARGVLLEGGAARACPTPLQWP